MNKDYQNLDYLWDNWNSHGLTIEKLISSANEVVSEKTQSEIWHLFSLKSMKNTALHAKQVIESGRDKSFIHDNLLFGCGFRNHDYKRRDLNQLVLFYNSYIDGRSRKNDKRNQRYR